MNRLEIGNLQFLDEITQKDDYLSVQVVQGFIALFVAIVGNGDMDIGLPRSTCEKLIEWLQKALEKSGENHVERRVDFPELGWKRALTTDEIMEYLKEILGHPSVIGATEFVDDDAQANAFLIVRINDGSIGITFFLNDNGEIEVHLPHTVCSSFIEWLKKAFEMTSLDKKR